MIAFDGFLNMMFFPASCLAIAGCILLFVKKKELISRNNIILLIGMLFILMLLWRVPVVIKKRYTLPLIVPGTILAVYFLKEVWSFKLKNLKIIGCKTLCCIFISSVAIVGSVKSMRAQEEKPYLNKVLELINNDRVQYGFQTPLVLVLGNIGGEIIFSEKHSSMIIRPEFDFHSKDHHGSFYGSIKLREPQNLLLRHAVMYVVISSYEPAAEFIEEWNEHYNQELELCYEYVRERNQMRFQIFRIISPYDIANLSSQQRLELLAESSILPNPNLLDKYELAEDSETIKELKNLGVQLANPTYLPVGYDFKVSKTANGSLEYNSNNQLRLQSNNHSYLVSSFKIDPQKRYVIGGKIIASKLSIIRLAISRKSSTNSGSGDVEIARLLVANGEHEFSGLIDLSDFNGNTKLMFGLVYGDVIWESIYLAPEELIGIGNNE